MDLFLDTLGGQAQAFLNLLMFVSVVLHIVFAGAVAKDAGAMQKRGQAPFLVSGPVWAFATLVGGMLVVLIYWMVHHSRFKRL